MALTSTNYSLARAIHEATNDVRRSFGLRTLGWEEKLADAAAHHSVAMAEQQFFSHQSPIAGHETPSARVAKVGGDFPAVGENLCMMARGATADRFVEQWLSSPGHRASLLDEDWEMTGIGTATTRDGHVLATQLFAVMSKIQLDVADLSAREARWFEFRLSAKIGRGHSIAAFISNEFSASADADSRGVAILSVELPCEAGTYHMGFGCLPKGSENAWIIVHDGFMHVEPSGRVDWNPNVGSHPGFTPLDQSIHTVVGTSLVVRLSGLAHVDAVCVVDKRLHTRFQGERPFGVELTFRGGTGCHTMDLGLPTDGDAYSCCRRLELDSDKGQLRTLR